MYKVLYLYALKIRVWNLLSILLFLIFTKYYLKERRNIFKCLYFFEFAESNNDKILNDKALYLNYMLSDVSHTYTLLHIYVC